MFSTMQAAWITGTYFVLFFPKQQGIDKAIGPIPYELREAWNFLWNKLAFDMIAGVERR